MSTDLTGLTPPPRHAGRHVPPGLMNLLDHLTDVPARVCTDLYDVLWQNPLADAVFGPVSAEPGPAGRDVREWFTGSSWRDRAPEEDWPHLPDGRNRRARQARRARRHRRPPVPVILVSTSRILTGE